MVPASRNRQERDHGTMACRSADIDDGQQRQAGDYAGKTAPARFDSRALLQASREIIIEHDGTDYRLRLTSNGKLILTK